MFSFLRVEMRGGRDEGEMGWDDIFEGVRRNPGGKAEAGRCSRRARVSVRDICRVGFVFCVLCFVERETGDGSMVYRGWDCGVGRVLSTP